MRTRILGQVCNALEQENTIFSRVALTTLSSGESNIATIEVEDGIYRFVFNKGGFVLSDFVFSYLEAFIEKKFHYRPIIDMSNIRAFGRITKYLVK